MEHAARSHIRKKLDEDPVYYQGLSDRLEEILAKFGDDWDQLALTLADFVEEVRQGREQDDTLELDPTLHAPFFDVLKEEREHDAPVGAQDERWLADLTVDLVERVIRPRVNVVAFWSNATRQDDLRGDIFVFLADTDVVEFDRADAVADRLMELAKANSDKMMREA